MKLKKLYLIAKLPIVVPVFNEEKNIFNELNKWEKKFRSFKVKKFKFLVINDSSTDNTLKQIQKINSKKFKFLIIKILVME